MSLHVRNVITAVSLLCMVATGCGGGGTLEDAAPPAPEVGTMTVNWTIERAGAASTCDVVDGRWVRMEVLAQGQGAGTVDVLPCSAATWTSEVDIATYDVSATLITPANVELNTVAIPDIVVKSGLDEARSVVFVVP